MRCAIFGDVNFIKNYCLKRIKLANMIANLDCN